MKFSELIDSCIECIKNFNPIIKTIDSHADDFLKDVSLPHSTPYIPPRMHVDSQVVNLLDILINREYSSRTPTRRCL
jgi:hypothetical protein